MTFLTIDQQTGLTAAFAGAWVNTNTITGAWTLKINVNSIVPPSGSSTVNVRLEFDDSISGTAALCGPTVSFANQLGSSYDKVHSFKQQDFPDLRLGIANSQIRLQLTDITSGASVSYRAWLEY